MAAVESIKQPNAYEKYLSNMKTLAHDAFKDHQLRRADSKQGRWLIVRKNTDGTWCSFYLTEVIVGYGGTLIAHGDIEPSMFKGFGPFEDPLSVVHWVARSNIVNYLDAKAATAFMERGSGLTSRFESDVAIWEVESRIKDRLEELEYEGEPDADDGELVAWRTALRELREGCLAWEQIRDALYDELTDAGCCDAGEMIYNIGEVPAPRLFYAQAACQKLLELLAAEED
jgi:hypothetical protein